MAISKKTIRHYFTVPATDAQIAEWMELQHNVSVSIRMIIKDYIAKHGMVDVSCQPMVLADNVSATSASHETSAYNDTTSEEPIDNDVPKAEDDHKTESESKTAETNNPVDDILKDLMN